jgi:glycosyltransferase involved in cell wall biosynthesis
MERRETVSLVIPLYNESEVIPHLIGEIERFRAIRPEIDQIVLVDDGSVDDTSELIRQHTSQISGYHLLCFSRNFGHQLAITAGLDLVESDAAVILDADLQDPLSAVVEMIERWKQGFDVVYGIRKERKGESRFKRLSAAGYYRFFRWMTDVKMPVDTGDFRLISRPVIDAYSRIGEQKPFVRGMISWLGFNQVGIEYTREERVAGQTKYTFGRMLRLAIDSLTSFSEKPLQIAVRLGLATSILSVIFALAWVVVAKYVLETAITGWASLLLVVTFFGGLNLFFIGLVGLYLSRVFDEVKGRPRYIVKSTWQSAQ